MLHQETLYPSHLESVAVERDEPFGFVNHLRRLKLEILLCCRMVSDHDVLRCFALYFLFTSEIILNSVLHKIFSL